LKLTTDRHKASCGLVVTAELLVSVDNEVLTESLYQFSGEWYKLLI